MSRPNTNTMGRTSRSFRMPALTKRVAQWTGSVGIGESALISRPRTPNPIIVHPMTRATQNAFG